MHKRLFKVFSLFAIFALVLMAVPVQSVGAVSNTIVISQVYGGGGNTGAPYTHDFIELYNRGTTTVSLAGWSVQYASATGTGNFGANSGQLTELSGSLAPGQYWLIQEAGGATGVPLPAPNVTDATPISMAAGAGKVALVNTTASLGCNGGSTPCSPAALATIVDLVGYGSANFFEGSAAAPALTNITAAFRKSNGAQDTDNNGSDFVTGAPNPRNTPPPDAAPTVSTTVPSSGTANVPLDSNITINFGELVDVTGSWFALSCATSGNHTATVSGSSPTFVLDVNTDFFRNEICTVTVLAANVTDQDINDPPDNMGADYTFQFSTVEDCEDPATFIHDVQGNGLASPINGSIAAIQGIVVGDFQGSDGLGGYYVQEEGTDADVDPSTSEGIFVFNTAFPVSVGDEVRVRGPVTEFNGLTEITSVWNSVQCSAGNTLPAVSELTLPVTAVSDFEAYEGMLVTFPQSLVISEYFNYDRFGELVLALPLDGETRAFTPTAIDEPGAPAQARALANSLRRITLDDGLGASNPSAVRHPNGGNFALDNRFRGGDTVQNAVGVMDFSFGLYRIQPTGPADYTAVNPRTVAPEAVGGDLQVAAMNTLNFFLTLDTTASDSGGGPCGGNANLDCRGADASQPLEFERQRNKLLAALAGLDADIIGLNELENTPNVEPLGDPNNGVVVGLNDLLGAGTYSFIDTGVIGTDAIRVGLIYKPANVTPIGPFQILDSSDDPRFIDTRSRPALAQTFEEVATGARFTVVVNHLKSKGSACSGDPDTGDGQGNCNQTRKAAAQALVDWIATDPTGSGDADYIIMGDLNSYAQEDPIDAIKAGADDTVGTFDDYTNLIFQYQGTYAYSYVFDGQAGYLDHALTFPSLTAQVTGAADWHINADEPDLLDYDTSFKSDAQDAIYEPNAYRSSDHDPVVVGLDLLHYNFTGFLQPIDNDPVFNVAKPGHSIPVKFSLDGDQGLDIFLSGYPLSIPIACEADAPVGIIEQTGTAGASTLAYDATTDTYTYVWKTEKSWAGTCRELVVILKDGSIHTAHFQFK